MVLPFRSAGFWMPELARTTSCINPLPPNSATIFTGTPFCRTTIGPSRNDAAERHIAGADLLGDIDAAAAHRVIHVEAGLRKITFAFRDLDRTERRQDRRRRK